MQKGAQVRAGGGCCCHFLSERQESSDLSKVTQYVSCSRTRTRYKVFRSGAQLFPNTIRACQNGWKLFFLKKLSLRGWTRDWAGQWVSQVWTPENLTQNSSTLDTKPVFYRGFSYSGKPSFMRLLWGNQFLKTHTSTVPSALSLRKEKNEVWWTFAHPTTPGRKLEKTRNPFLTYSAQSPELLLETEADHPHF